MIDPSDFGTFSQMVVDAIQGGNWSLVAALALILVVYGVRALFGEKLPFLKTDLGAAGFTFVMGFLGAVASALVGGAAVNGALFLAALKVTFAAMGGFVAVKKLAGPLLEALLGKLGVKLPGDLLAKATQAGESAVAANPAKGLEGVVGKPVEIE